MNQTMLHKDLSELPEAELEELRGVFDMFIGGLQAVGLRIISDDMAEFFKDAIMHKLATETMSQKTLEKYQYWYKYTDKGISTDDIFPAKK